MVDLTDEECIHMRNVRTMRASARRVLFDTAHDYAEVFPDPSPVALVAASDAYRLNFGPLTVARRFNSEGMSGDPHIYARTLVAYTH